MVRALDQPVRVLNAFFIAFDPQITRAVPLLLLLIGVFACGILVSMSLFGVALAGLLSMRALERIGHGAGALVGVSSVVLGVVWVLTA